MEGINSTSNDNAYIKDLQTPKVKEEKKGDQTDFMKLMIAQLQNQNPLDPKDGAEFLSQLAQFTQVEGITRLNEQVEGLSNRFSSSQALQATALVGRKVRVETNQSLYTPGGEVTGMAELPASSTNINMTVTDASGRLISQIKLPTSSAGEIPLLWDGTNQDGQKVPEGIYKISVKAGQGGKMVELRTELDSNVNSVTIGVGGAMTLNVAAVGALPLAEVTQIK
ncbi:MAG: flagellar hook assembly protein FlgD [Pseudomonadales bacterium]|nr:flagellar hook assembly protein FlgD [Pseudomonadales bacterium]